jgi:hypothetical protein
MADPNVTVLNDFSGTTVEERTRKSGKKVVTISMESTPILIHHNPLELGRPVAEAIASLAREQMAGIQERVSEATVEYREKVARAYDRGAPWAVKRYSGGRTGATPPQGSDRMFNDSGRMAKSVTANANKAEGGWTVNVAANRLDRSSFPGDSFNRMVTRLVELVPVLRNPLAQRPVVETIERTWRAMHQKQAMAAAEKQGQFIRRGVLEGLKTLRQVLGA